ncbi:RNA polymerase-associated protein RapA [Halomonas sp. MCCC 1A17488]|uniref:RNA polymerase-associated protein RapA n=1 Tax=Billgrantia sulfidoxydans TaxID=2733484 RepID=A0ABX7WBP3_9GAMM|nr:MULTISPECIES: RNA polymerase-associated protein RapA [Halomonas]MCE8017920.1 RNA polymerase-associated protein RapA [Halomonas sp. MCCC 1A17488]MCG3241253.1 RNA polymerase-associated protein RapA [Halomonas sp. MCCC 1A17488]QPP49095.1 RNA polymerase-associated protein RapA [Halomonas sp. SS10-MC5]QTP56429.1 RNA polymerase-associated protein RapA [Halomonas sulfidoxydans]
MSDFSPGQRWISDGEADLGLGTILSCDHRSVTVLFGASQETRTYSSRQAPLTRVAFGSGDRIQSSDGWHLTVDDSKEVDGLIVYIGEDDQGELRELPEARLADTMQFDQARDRLLTGQVDRNDWFDLRFRTLHHHHRIEQNPALGLAGPRIDLIPHQLYIADEVARRHAPRVLLADEVGLGKTIEAGLILHRMLLTGRAQRALILVPPSLTHQWLVELLRRFALEVTLLDEQQSLAQAESNPFESGQLILASQEWLFANPHRQEQAASSDWDLLIVDEAHHLDWSADQVGPGYACVERLAKAVPGVLLLTATPEQMGLESHFARLRLLDPDRYHSLDAFRDEEQHYVEVAQSIDALEALPAGGREARSSVAAVIDEPDSLALLDLLSNPECGAAQQASARDQLREQLLDRHGTGRVMFRNSRRHVGGFPERRLHLAALTLPSAYRRVLRKLERDEDYLDELLIETGLDHPDVLIYPDATYRALSDDPLNAEPWWQFDPRVTWLLERLADDSEQGFANDKVLVIAHGRETAQGLAEALRVLGGLHAPVFHEGLTLVERDRAAAAFADEEEGSQVLVCSEIGSEGRNFQFCRHLVMFDLPQHPDQLEQRIGRLDRIGQRHAIEIHVPLFEASPGERLLRWFSEGMEAFASPHGVGNELFDAFGDALAEALLDDEALEDVISETRALFENRLAQRDAGRNRLLELNACRPARAEAVAAAIRELDDDPALTRYLDQALDIFGVDGQELGGGLLHLQPGPQMLDGLPGLAKGEEGFTATLSRERALARDDVQRLSWEHPLLREMMARILDGTMGNTALALLQHPAIPAGRLMTELVFRTYCPAPRRLHVNRFLPPTAVRVLLDESGAVLSDKVSFTGLSKNLRKVKKAMARDLIRSRHDQLRELLVLGEQEAERELPSIVEGAQVRMRRELDGELARLEALARLNPAVREAELEALRRERGELDAAIDGTRLRLDAVRVIVTVGEESR